METVVVEVMPRGGELDERESAMTGVAAKVGYAQFTRVRVGKRFELRTVGPVTGEVLDSARAFAQEILSNPATEQVVNVFASRASRAS